MFQGSNLSAITSLYIVSLLLEVVGGKTITNAVAEIVLYPFMSSLRDTIEGSTEKLFSNHLNNVHKLVYSGSEYGGGGIINGNLCGKPVPSYSHSINFSVDGSVCQERFVEFICLEVFVSWIKWECISCEKRHSPVVRLIYLLSINYDVIPESMVKSFTRTRIWWKISRRSLLMDQLYLMLSYVSYTRCIIVVSYMMLAVNKGNFIM